VMNLPLWFGSGQPEQARLSRMIHSPVKPYATAPLAWLSTRFHRGTDLLMLRQTQ
jgi:hypothetical protein